MDKVMPKAIFIILTLAGFASGAEMEVTDRLTVDGSMLLKSTLTVSGAGIEVRSGTSTAYSLAVGTSTNYSLTVSTGGRLQANEIYRGTYSVLDSSMLDSFTLKLDTTTNKIKLADRIEQNIMLDAFKIAVSSSLSKFNMVDGIMDEFEDETGVDTVNSLNQAYDSINNFYSPKKLMGGIDAYAKLMLHYNGVGGSKEIQDSGETGHIVNQVGTAALSTAQKTIGNCSLFLDGSSGYVTLPDHSDWDLATGIVTIDCWFYMNALPTLTNCFTICGQAVDGNNFWVLAIAIRSGGEIIFNTYVNGARKVSNSCRSNLNLQAQTWYHLAYVGTGTDTNAKIYLNGIARLDEGYSTAMKPFPTNFAEELWVGNTKGNISGDLGGFVPFNGYIDELRISNGIARWTSDFTPPTTPYTSDSYTKLLLHMESLDVSSAVPKTPKFVGTAQLDTAQKEFGSASLSLNGSSDYVTLPDSEDWNFGTEDFTIDFWVRFASVSGEQMMVSRVQNGNNHFWIEKYTAGAISVQFTAGGSDTAVFATTSNVLTTAGVWYHIAVVRNGTAAYIFLNGFSQTLSTTKAFNGSVGDIVSPFYVGASQTYNVYYLNGWLDEVRISKGIARWTTNFTPPTSEYSTTNLTYNMSLKSNATTAVATPSNARVVLFEEDADSCTLNTDIKASVSRDNGTTYSTATLANEGDWSTGKRILSGVVDISTQPGGTYMKWKVDTSNNRDMKLHGVGLNWD